MDGDLPTENFHLISSCPCWAYTRKGKATRKRALAFGVVRKLKFEKIMKKIVCILIFTFLSATANAAFVENLKIERVQASPNGGFLLFFDKDVHSNCVTSGKNVVYAYPDKAGMTDSGLKSLLSVALVGFTADKNTAIHFDESSNECWVQYVTVDK